MFRYLVTNSYIRMIQYQNTASVDADRFENEIAAYAEHFCPVTTEDLDRFLKPVNGQRKSRDSLLPYLTDYAISMM